MRTIIVVATVSLGVLASGPAGAFLVRGYVIANGGTSAVPSSNGSFKLYGTLGAPAARASLGGSQRVCSGFWCFGGPQVLDVPSGGALPAAFALGGTTPTPTRDEVRFRMALPTAATVRLAVYDVAGRQAGDAVTRRLDAGEHDLFWRAPRRETGVYFMRLTTDGGYEARRTIIVVR